MKRVKHLTSVLLALVMALALAVPAFAAAPQNYSITIENDKTGHTYEAYQIFSGTVSSDAATTGVTDGPNLGDIQWGAGVKNTDSLVAKLKTDMSTVFGSLGENPTAADVAAALDGADAETAAAFADVVSEYLADTPTGTSDTHTGTAYVIEGLPAGYYLVKDEDSSLSGEAHDAYTDYIVQVLGNVTMAPKSDIPTIEKKVKEESIATDNGWGAGYNDVADYDIGDAVPFKLIATIPDMSGYNGYQFVITDTLSTGLSLNQDSIKVFVANSKAVDEGTDLKNDTDYTLATTGIDTASFTLTFDNMEGNTKITGGQYIIVTYTATLNDNAEIGLDGNTNKVDLTYSNDPNSDSKGKTPEDTVIVFTYELDGDKVKADEPQTKLAGAEFVLLNSDKTKVAQVGEDGKIDGWVDVPEETDTYEEWATFDTTNNVIMTSNEQGDFGVSGIDEGTYYLREIKAPSGYNLLTDDLKLEIAASTGEKQDYTDGQAAQVLTSLTIKVGDGAAQNGDATNGTVTVQVENNVGALLPETGGMGTTLFYLIGGVLVLGVVVVLIARKRAGRE